MSATKRRGGVGKGKSESKKAASRVTEFMNGPLGSFINYVTRDEEWEEGQFASKMSRVTRDVVSERARMFHCSQS